MRELTTPAIEMKGIWFSYERTPILENISFTLKQGDFLGMIGPNGGGKTTLLKLLLGILKPDRGLIRVLGEEPHRARRRVGYVPQNTDANNTFPVSVMDVVLMGRLAITRMGKNFSSKDRPMVEEALRKVGMWNRKNTQIGKLSGGQRQRVLIARALVAEPEILFLDEPTAKVDPEFESNIYDFLKELNQRATIMTITHDVGVISRYVKSVACVNRTLIYHEEAQITNEMLEMAYECPVDLIAHGIPHRVLPHHEHH
ncbi:MAG: ABC transporter ATP-binding protein [Deltaproteobacteria bacterium]|jgi:zinc transport system ATP-binding protein|nr:ABC transporter ATP-binding protein [Deltaproteobacteria bacterium]